MSVLDRIAFHQGRRDEVPNQELAEELAEAQDAEGIEEIARNLWNPDKNIQSDCLKVLYEVGARKPELIGGHGEYLVTIALCKMCHGPELTGGPPLEPGSPAAPNIAAHAVPGGWTEHGFIDAIRSGVIPDGRALDPEAMPWEFYAKMTDEELQAIWRYLGSLSSN